MHKRWQNAVQANPLCRLTDDPLLAVLGHNIRCRSKEFNALGVCHFATRRISKEQTRPKTIPMENTNFCNELQPLVECRQIRKIFRKLYPPNGLSYVT